MLRAVADVDVEVIVVDNASADNSVEYLMPLFPSVNFIRSDKNLGYAKANNLGVGYAKGKHILFLNPDTILGENTVQKCLKFLYENENCGAIGVRMMNGSGAFLPESKRNIPNVSNSVWKLLGKDLKDNSKTNNYYALHVDEVQVADVQILSGAFMLLSHKAIERAVGFDEDFFMFGEDIDLSYRILKTGLTNYYLGNETILHFKGESTIRHSATFRKNFYGAMQIFVRKHYQHQLLKRLVLLGGSWFAGFLAANKQPVENSEPPVPQSFRVIGYIEDFSDGLKAFLSTRKYTVSTEQLKEGDNTILFCIGIFRMEDALRVMEKNWGKKYFFHFSGSGSVVGSSNQETRGQAFILN